MHGDQGIEPQRQRLIHEGMEPGDDDTLLEQLVKDGATLCLVVQVVEVTINARVPEAGSAGVTTLITLQVALARDDVACLKRLVADRTGMPCQAQEIIFWCPPPPPTHARARTLSWPPSHARTAAHA